MGYSTSGRRRKGHENARAQPLQWEALETAEVTDEEVVEAQRELQIYYEVNRCLIHSSPDSVHEAIETQSVSSSSSSPPSSYYSSLSSSSSSFSTTSLPMRYSRRRRRAASPREASRTDNMPRAQQSVRLQASSSSSTSPSPSSSHVDASSQSFASFPSSSPPLLPRTTNVSGAKNNMLAMAGPSQHAPSFRGQKRYSATATARPARGNRETSQQPASQLIPWWKQWESVAVNLANVPLDANTFTIWSAFRKEGNVFSIDLFEDGHGNKEGKGKVRFK